MTFKRNDLLSTKGYQVEDIGTTLVLCHNDLHPHNIMANHPLDVVSFAAYHVWTDQLYMSIKCSPMIARGSRYGWSFSDKPLYLDLPFSAASSLKMVTSLLRQRSEHADRISSSFLHTLTVLLPFLPVYYHQYLERINYSRSCALCKRGGRSILGYALEIFLSMVFASFGLSRSFGVRLASFSTVFRDANGPIGSYHRFVYTTRVS